MQTSKKGINYIIKEEGKINYEYYCPAGVPTIGVGCVTKYLGKEILQKFKKVELSEIKIIGKIMPVVDEDRFVITATDKQIYDLLIQRLADFELAVNENVSIELKQHQFDALVSFCFNIGVANFKKSTLLKKVNAKASNDEIEKWFSVWNKAKGKILPVLVNRRQREINLFLNGKY